ncbi:diacylglycerol kinase [Planosporangium mesophilum]|uniref:Diacylglycerol kinase n=2 Tax=Planosporangium mesophilum TaxID=689768 RepID=A0A8J3TQ70_9ACTN|nr:diacylglycerol kinase family protein [Planosporangium mesophilum]GII25365.1 diacylglycerol kinase [Planosporangium mesophilum]
MLLVTNEQAGRTGTEAVAEVVDELGGESSVEVIVCRQDSDLEAMLDRRAGRAVVVVGGDGSLHTLVKRLWRRGEAADCTVGLIPLGTGNDFARGVGIPLDHREAARLIRDGKPRPVDLIVDDADGVAVNAVHVGAGAEAAMAFRPWKRYLKTAAFPVGAVVAGFTVKGWRLRVEVDGKLITSDRRRVLMAGLSNAPTIAGGSAELGPGADPTDGVAEVTVSLATGRLARVGYALALLRGRHPERSDVIHLSGTEVTISGSPFHVNADGELSGPVRRREWRLVPGAWRCVLPE